MVAATNRRQEVEVGLEVFSPPTRPAEMNRAFQRHLARAAEQHAPGQWQSMPSAAVHDAMFVADKMPAAMKFPLCLNGGSHLVSEHSSVSDVARGAQGRASVEAGVLKSATA